MFDIMIWLFVQLFWVTLLFGLPCLFFIRVYVAFKKPYTYKEKLIIICTPLSLGYFYIEKEETHLKKRYQMLSILFFITGFIGSIFILYIHLGLNMI